MSSRRIFLGQMARTAAACAVTAGLGRRAATGGEPGAAKPAPLPYVPIEQIPNHRQLMRDVIIALSDYCRARHPGFILLLRNAPELLIKAQREVDWQTARDPAAAAAGRITPAGTVNGAVLQAIDSMLIDGPYFGFERADSPTRGSDAEPLLAAARLLRGEGRRCLAIDYCQDAKQRGEASRLARQAGLVEYIDGDGNRRLDHIPTVPPASENPRHIGNLAAADNFLPLLSADAFARKDQWIGALAATNYDLLLVDPFFRGQSLTLAEVAALRFKRLGSQRLFLAPLPVGFAATDRFYWQAGWHSGMPDWVGPQDPDRPDHYLASYWLDSWKKLLGSYVTGLCDLGIDGIVFDGADSYLFFEAMLPF